MDGQEAGDLLEECVRAAAAAGHSAHEEPQRLNHCSCRESLGDELASLLQDAMEMKWPFVPEKWQYKQSISAEDKSNVNDLISRHLPQLLAFLKASITAQDVHAALAVVFLVDRFFYWTDESSRLLKIAKLLHGRHPGVPLAPQLLIRQARVHLNSGKLQKAEYILCSLINNSGTTGCWPYRSDSDRALVQAVSVQVRGMILQKLGLWLQAAELIWASLVGYFALPQPDKKGIGTSLGILANILVSMNDEDFQTFKTSPHIDSCFLDGGHRLLSAAGAAKMAVVYSQYTSLYVLTNVVTQGTCLLSYSFSVQCPPAQRPSFRLRAKEAFAVGLLTRRDDERVTSKQELHTFVKAAYSLAVTHKWLGAPSEVVTEAVHVCQKALGHFYDYCHADTQDKNVFCTDVMRLIARVKLLLRVEPFVSSNEGSFIPDGYGDAAGDVSVRFTPESFSRVMRRFQKYHASLDETANPRCKGGRRGAKDQADGAGLCITALETTVGTECSTQVRSLDVPRGDGVPQQRAPDPAPMLDRCETVDSSDSLGSSWKNFSLSSSSGSSWASCGGFAGSGAVLRDSSASSRSFFPTTEVDDDQKEGRGVGSCTQRSAVPSTSSSSGSRDSEKFEVIEGAVETLGTDDEASGAVQSLSQLLLRTSSSGLSDSFSSQSSWEKISVDQSSTTNREAQTPDLRAGTESPSTESTGSFVCLEALDSARKDQSKDLNGSDTASSLVTPEQCSTTESSSENSSEIRNPWCHRCRQDSAGPGLTPERQYFLSQQDYFSLLAGVCHECLLKRLQSDKKQFKLKRYEAAQSALHLKFSKATGLWTARETCVYIGKPMGKEGKQRSAIWVQFLHQEERLSSYVGKDYKNPKELQFHLKDVERQMTAQYYVTEFNKSLYDRDVLAQIFFIPSEALLILTGDEIEACVTVEPYMLGDFVKLTNNKEKKNNSLQATAYGLAFGHFTYLLSGCQEVVVDLQGWVTANGKGLTYLTDPQIHSTKSPQGPGNFAGRGLRYFLEEQHGPECNSICQLLKLPSMAKPQVLPEK